MNSNVESYLVGLNADIIKKDYIANAKLSNKSQNLLAYTIIQKEYEKKNSAIFTIKTDKFLELRTEIVKLFPTENPLVYYSPYNKYSKSLASGKLWDQYNYIKKKLRSTTNTVEPPNKEITEDVFEKLAFLKSCTDNVSKIYEYWTDTYSTRILKFKDENYTIQQYFGDFAFLKKDDGYKLLCMDFDLQYPNKSDKLYVMWPDVNQQLIDICVQKKSTDYQDILKNKNNLTGFRLLTCLLGQSIYRKKNANTKRVKISKVECLESFMHLVKVKNYFPYFFLFV